MSFFHYTSLDGIKGIVENKEMWASNINFLNDQREWHHFDSILNEAIKELELPFTLGDKVYESHKEIIKALFPFDRKRIDEFRFVLSFSKVPDCKSQWMEYCPKFAGYALEFSDFPISDYKKIGSKMHNTSCDGIQLTKCIYNKVEQIERIKSVIIDTNDKCKSSKSVIHKISTLLSDLRYQFKHHGFAEEREYRWYGQADSNMDVRVKNGIMVPFVRVPVDITKLSAIWVGPSPVQDKAAQGLVFWWSVLQRNDNSYIYKNSKTGVLSIRKSEIPYSFI